MLRFSLYDLDFAAHYLIFQLTFLFISEKLQSAITFEVNGWLSLFPLRGLFFAKLRFQLLGHRDQLKDHEAMNAIRRISQQAGLMLTLY